MTHPVQYPPNTAEYQRKNHTGNYFNMTSIELDTVWAGRRLGSVTLFKRHRLGWSLARCVSISDVSPRPFRDHVFPRGGSAIPQRSIEG